MSILKYISGKKNFEFAPTTKTFIAYFAAVWLLLRIFFFFELVNSQRKIYESEGAYENERVEQDDQVVYMTENTFHIEIYCYYRDGRFVTS